MQKILNKTIMLTIPLSITLTSFAHANPSQEAQAFAAQFKKEPLKPKLTAEDVLNKYAENKDNAKNTNVEITTINETPTPLNIYGEGIPTDYKYIPTENDIVTLEDEPVYDGSKYNFD